MTKLPDSSGGIRLRQGGRRAKTRAKAAWVSTETWYCRECHAEIHETRDGDWEVDLIGQDGEIASTLLLPPIDSIPRRAAETWLRSELAGRRCLPWSILVDRARHAGIAARTLRRARGYLGLVKVRSYRDCLWRLPESAERLDKLDAANPTATRDTSFGHVRQREASLCRPTAKKRSAP